MPNNNISRSSFFTTNRGNQTLAKLTTLLALASMVVATTPSIALPEETYTAAEIPDVLTKVIGLLVGVFAAAVFVKLLTQPCRRLNREFMAEARDVEDNRDIEAQAFVIGAHRSA